MQCDRSFPSPLAGEGGARPRSGWEGEGTSSPMTFPARDHADLTFANSQGMCTVPHPPKPSAWAPPSPEMGEG